jgi:molybdopterin-guanine dinucleotide biosynthesis protein MobB
MMEPHRKNNPAAELIAICGWKNSGKTTLIEQLIPRLLRQGLRVAVIKHDTHGIEVDRPGKDSDRFYKAGANVLLKGPGEEMVHRHLEEEPPLHEAIDRLLPSHDLVIVEGHKGTPLPKIWLDNEDGDAPPESVGRLLLRLRFNEDRVEAVWPLIMNHLKERTPLYGCVLIGGKSERMGRPKHLMETQGATWLERTLKKLEEVASKVVIAGEGLVPEKMSDRVRLPDAPGVRGPMAGILSAMRWNPGVSWLVAACDMPDLSKEALEWILSQRRPGVWCVMPRVREVHPLLAYYDFRARTLLERLARSGDFALHRLAGDQKVFTPEPPGDLQIAWRNINTREDLHRYRSP